MKSSLIYKLSVSACIVLAVTMLLYAWITVGNLRRLLLDEAVSDTDKLSETLIRTTHYQMLENDRKRVYQMISEVGTQQGVVAIRLINKEGSIIFSTDRREIGGVMDKSAEACRACHSGERPLLHAPSMNRSTMYETGGKKVLGMTRAIYNDSRCSAAACHFHSPTSRVLGVLNVVVSLQPMQDQVSSLRRKTVILTLFLLALIGVVLTMVTQEMVNRPLRRLLAHTVRVAEGDLESRVEIEARDEMGELADAFNSMTAKLGKARAELEDWAKNLESKVEQRTNELQLMQSQLIRSEKLASMGELVAGIAHEINNPLTGILIFGSLLEKDPRLHVELREDVTVICRETTRCADIVKGLLEFCRESVPEKRETDLNGVIEDALELVVHQSLFQNISIRRDYHPRLPQLFLDRNQIEQVFVNMVVNAGQAMPEGGELSLKTAVEGEHVAVYIGDTGCGIPQEDLSRIFDPFFTTKETEGTGLGLSVSYGIIHNHGGDIEVTSTPGEGTCFAIRLPMSGDGGAA